MISTTDIIARHTVKTAGLPFETGSIEFCLFNLFRCLRRNVQRRPIRTTANFHTFKCSRQDAHFNVELRLNSNCKQRGGTAREEFLDRGYIHGENDTISPMDPNTYRSNFLNGKFKHDKIINVSFACVYC